MIAADATICVARVFEAEHKKKFELCCVIAQPVKSNLNKKLDPKQKTIQAFNIDA